MFGFGYAYIEVVVYSHEVRIVKQSKYIEWTPKCNKISWFLYFFTTNLQKVILILWLWLCGKNIFCNTCFMFSLCLTKVWWYMASCTWWTRCWAVAWCLRVPDYCPNQCWLTYMLFYNIAQRISCHLQSHVLKIWWIYIYISPGQIWTVFLHPCFMYNICIGYKRTLV